MQQSAPSVVRLQVRPDEVAMDRRTFLQLLSAGTASAAFPASIARALEMPANHATGTIRDVEHVVFLMQENRSFDHYFGTMRGVRGFGDPRAVLLASGEPVWKQPGKDGEGYVLPFHPPAPESDEAGLGLTFLEDLAHDWTTTHAAVNDGRHDRWVPSKGATTMAHLTRSDIPYHYALADAFTVCDAYYCSLLGPTDPNRYHMWTGWVGNDGAAGGPAVGNEESGYGWITYPERLQKAGVSWKVYQDVGTGLSLKREWGAAKDAYIGNYGDNSLLYFTQYQRAADSPLAKRAKTGTRIEKGGTLFEHFAADVKGNRLPQVSWVVSPEAYSEHPNWPANYGAWYVSQILEALTANPKVWSSTALFVMYDENDGFFDHMVPPLPPFSSSKEMGAHGASTVPTTHEIFPGNKKYPAGPYGLGVRVPMLVISPWSRGGWVNSEVFDHTSMIRFLEKRFGVEEPNITAWRRAVTGDLMSAFDFTKPNAAVMRLPSTVGYRPPDGERHPDYKPAPPPAQKMPVQEAGTRPARALPYSLGVGVRADRQQRTVELRLQNAGTAGAVFHVRSGDGKSGPWNYTVGAHDELSGSFAAAEDGGYDLSVYGPNGFFREIKGSFADGATSVEVEDVVTVTRSGTVASPGIMLMLTNPGADSITIRGGYKQASAPVIVAAGAKTERHFPLEKNFGWYDLVVECGAGFRRHFAGHVETGKDSVSDPMMERV
jgi:phospholipase C